MHTRGGVDAERCSFEPSVAVFIFHKRHRCPSMGNNDAYSLFAGERHPKLFGSKVREGWPEVADFNDNVMKQPVLRHTVLQGSGAPASSLWQT